MKQRIIKIAPYTLAFFVVAFHAVFGTVWIFSNQAIQGSDEVDYIHSAQRFERFWPKDWSSPLSALQQLTSMPDYAPAAPGSLILAKITGDIFGRSLANWRMISLCAYLLTMVILFFMGKQIAGPWGGMLATVFFACFPYGFIQSRYFNGFAVSGCCVTATIFLMLKTKNLTRWSIAGLFGIVFGFALIVERGSPPIVLLGPVAAYCIATGIYHLKTAPRVLFTSLIVLVLAAVFSWLIAGRYLLDYLIRAADHNRQMMSVPYYPARIHYDFFIQKGIRWVVDRPYAAFMLYGAIVAMFREKTGKKLLIGAGVLYLLINMEWLGFRSALLWLYLAVFLGSLVLIKTRFAHVIIAWIAVPLVIFSSFATKDLEYIYAVIPAFALGLSALVIHLAESKKIKIASVAMLTVFISVSLFQFLAVSFPEKQGLRSAYEKLPGFFRFANGDERFGPMTTSRQAQAKRVWEVFGYPKTGMILYFPHQWNPEFEGPIPTEYESGGYQWAVEMQIYMDFMNQGPDHIVFSERNWPKYPWAKNNKELLLVYRPMELRDIEHFRSDFDRDEYNLIISFMSDVMETRLLDILDGLPGERMGQLRLFPERDAALLLSK